ncbi:hypothetical protein [Phenylobacterium sp. J367]|uniref:hypothetical protein n=1 Tax=Phenylobacterium sp. J367 TaxID=2898435 RepID=UPI0021511606|nr:hypothetical protein [Phenylobacterium sp. J367]MCR5880311.1 hypothetical protein [Phenylobacterium sp. J367]
MAADADVLAVPVSPNYEAPFALAFEDDEAEMSPHQEINERRARVENPELLRRLRGL